MSDFGCPYQNYGCFFVGRESSVYSHTSTCIYGQVHDLSQRLAASEQVVADLEARLQQERAMLAERDATILRLKHMHLQKDDLLYQNGIPVPVELQVSEVSADQRHKAQRLSGQMKMPPNPQPRQPLQQLPPQAPKVAVPQPLAKPQHQQQQHQQQLPEQLKEQIQQYRRQQPQPTDALYGFEQPSAFPVPDTILPSIGTLQHIQPHANGSYIQTDNNTTTTIFEDTWYFDNLRRVEAELILSSCGCDTMLVRPSSVAGCFALSKYTISNNCFTHLLISQTPSGYCLDNSLDKNIYPNLNQMMAFSPECIGFFPAGIVHKLQAAEDLSKIERQIQPEDVKRERMRACVIEELITTENNYMNDLRILMKHYEQPLRRNSKVLSKDEILELFSNVGELLEISQSFFSFLDQRKKEKEARQGQYQIADLFLNMAEQFKAYTVYCINYPNAVTRLDKCLQKSSFISIEKQALSAAETRGLGLGGYLIKPVQRLCKYPLLLKELLKHTPDTHTEHATLVSALRKIEQVVEYVNERKKMAENANRMDTIAACLEGIENFELKSAPRFFVAELNVKRKEEKTEYKLFLFNDILVYARLSKKGRSCIYRYRGRIPLDMLRVVDLIADTTVDTFAFELLNQSVSSHTSDEAAMFCAESDEAKKQFIMQIKRAQKDYYNEHKDQIKAEAKARRFLEDFQFKQDDARGTVRGTTRGSVRSSVHPSRAPIPQFSNSKSVSPPLTPSSSGSSVSAAINSAVTHSEPPSPNLAFKQRRLGLSAPSPLCQSTAEIVVQKRASITPQ